jgi:hypothetical protein
MHGRESDWKKFTKLKKIALERFCESVLDESRMLCDRENLTSHERYLDLYKIIQKRDKELGRAFDGHSRSRADQQLRDMYNKGLVTDEELSKFSEETQSFVTLRFGDASRLLKR